MLDLSTKLGILSDAAKYDVSCSSSGSQRDNTSKGIGNSTGMGICHSFTQDGRCVSLLKILLTNICIYDCTYCVSRKSNDNLKTAFTVNEVVELTINFYRRNYIEGLFLSSGIFKNADYTMERLMRVAKELRTKHNFNGYIHLKTIPGASSEIILEAGKYADRLSCNIELPSEDSLRKLAPDKNYAQVLHPMQEIHRHILNNKVEKGKPSKSNFAPAGQTTQMIVGASPETDLQILHLSDELYKKHKLTRIYYAAFAPIQAQEETTNYGKSILLRENRLYQADWLMRIYGFSYQEILHKGKPNLEQEIDPKLSYALDHPEIFPIEINTAPYELLIRVPGIGIRSAEKIIEARKFHSLHFEQLKKIGVVLIKAVYFITCSGKSRVKKTLQRESLKAKIMGKEKHLQQLGLTF